MKIKFIALSLVATASLAACGGTASDSDQVVALGNKVISDLKSGNVSAMAGLMDPSCSGAFLGNVAVAKAFGIDAGELYKSMAESFKGKVEKSNIRIDGTKAYSTDDNELLAVKIDGHWYMDCSEQTDPSTLSS